MTRVPMKSRRKEDGADTRTPVPRGQLVRLPTQTCCVEAQEEPRRHVMNHTLRSSPRDEGIARARRMEDRGVVQEGAKSSLVIRSHDGTSPGERGRELE